MIDQTNKPARLLQRLDEIGQALERTGKALALIGLGSVGVERARLDEFSDLDFFVIAKDGCKGSFIQDLTWLRSVHPVAYAFQNTADGYKALFADGVYCEFAVFESGELENIPYAQGRVVWRLADFDPAQAHPKYASPAPEVHTPEWMLGEALTCLYVGLSRYRRGEKLSAFRFVQVYSVDRIVELAASLEQEQPEFSDPFSAERRFEQRFPETARALAACMQGYDATPQSALTILAFLGRHFEINPAMQAAIQSYAQGEWLWKDSS